MPASIRNNADNKEIRFGFLSDVHGQVQINVRSLQSSRAISASILPASRKIEDPSVCTVLSQVHVASDLFIKACVFSSNFNAKSVVIQSQYQSFNNTKRSWNQLLTLPIDYSLLSVGDYISIELYEIVATKHQLFGITYLPLFDHALLSLRSGTQKLPVYKTSLPPLQIVDALSQCNANLSSPELKLSLYENGEIPKSSWLDPLSLPMVEKSVIPLTAHDYYLLVELPQVQHPIVYSDMSYRVPTLGPVESAQLPVQSQATVIIKSIEIPQSSTPGQEDIKFIDDAMVLASSAAGQPTNHTVLDPIELKYHKLERNINNSILDRDIKPSPQLRDDLLRILAKPTSIELSDFEKNLIWKFRYYLSRNNVGQSSENRAAPSFLPKFLKSINWDNDSELTHVFEEIIPQYWSINKLQIGDALELLDNYFNPFTLVPSILPPSSQSKNNSKLNNAKFGQVFKYVASLRQFAVDRLKLASSDELLLYLLQLVQALKYEARIYGRELLAPDSLTEAPLAEFLIERAVETPHLGNYFYWYVKVEHEDQLRLGPGVLQTRVYTLVLNRYIERLKAHSLAHKLPHYQHLKCQIWFIKKLTILVEVIRSTFKRNEPTAKKREFLKQYLANTSNELVKFPEPFPLPLDPTVMICGCYPEQLLVFKSSLAPLKITFKTLLLPPKQSRTGSQMFSRKSQRYGSYALMFKIGDDLRQDQLVIQIINLMDQLLKKENLDLRLTPYKILATGPDAGLIQFVPNDTLDAVLARTYNNSMPPNTANGRPANGILSMLRIHSQTMHVAEPMAASVLDLRPSRAETGITPPQHAIANDLGVSLVVMDNYVKSCAGYCVITYILGVGDRHLDNLLLSPNGKFWHADFGYILGRDPKPFPPLMKLPIQVIDGMGGMNHENFHVFESYCFITYTTLRKSSNLILNLFQLMVDANIPDIKIDSARAVEKVQEKLCLDMSEEEAIMHFQVLINDSVNAFLPVVIDRLHSLTQYWRA